MQENMYGVDQRSWLQMTEGDRGQWNQLMAASGAQPRPMVDPTTLPDYRPDMMYDNYGTIAYAYGPGGGSSGPSTSGMNTVGPPNSGGGAGSVGSGYGYAPPGAGLSPLAPGTGQGKGIYDDAAMYRGGDFQGGGSGDFAFSAPTENIQGTPLADWSLSNYAPGSDPNSTPYDGFTGVNELGDYYVARNELGDPIYNYSGGGIGSDAGATRGRIADYIASGGGGALPNVGRLPGDIGSTPMSNPNPNVGYNPGMENYFANPGMNQYNPNIYQQQLQDILRGIDQGTGQQNLDPNWLVPGGTGPGGKSYYQGDNNTPLISSGG